MPESLKKEQSKMCQKEGGFSFLKSCQGRGVRSQKREISLTPDSYNLSPYF